jgi:hypothetical protein
MDFLNVGGFTVKAGKNIEFQEWVRANSSALAKVFPKGTELVGIYANVFSSEKHSGAYKLVIRMDSYGAMDRLAAAGKENPEFMRLASEFASFSDVRLGADFSSEILKSVADITITADYPEE